MVVDSHHIWNEDFGDCGFCYSILYHSHNSSLTRSGQCTWLVICNKILISFQWNSNTDRLCCSTLNCVQFISDRGKTSFNRQSLMTVIRWKIDDTFRFFETQGIWNSGIGITRSYVFLPLFVLSTFRCLQYWPTSGGEHFVQVKMTRMARAEASTIELWWERWRTMSPSRRSVTLNQSASQIMATIELKSTGY